MKKSLKKIAEDKAKDPANKDLEVYKDPEIQETCKKEGVKVCWSCGGINCFIKQQHCLKANKAKSFLGHCTGKPAKFEDLSKYGVPWVPQLKKKTPKPESNTSNIKISAKIN